MRFSTEGLSLRYPGVDGWALDQVSISVPDGSLYAVLGPNGSGKSTLMKTLLGVLSPERGRAVVDDTPVLDWTRRELARVVGVVSQAETIAFPLTVRELVAMGRYPHMGALRGESSHDKGAIAHALDQCDAGHLTKRDVTTLSGGELQRVRIARALAQEPRALVLDEPTASLDIRHEMAILESLRAWADDGMTVVVVTHGLDQAARFADRMLLLSRGRVAAEGRPEEVLRAETLEEVYGWPIAVEHDSITESMRVTPLRSRDGATQAPPRR